MNKKEELSYYLSVTKGILILSEDLKEHVEVNGEKDIREYAVDDLRFKPRKKKEKIQLTQEELKELAALEDREGKSKLEDN